MISTENVMKIKVVELIKLYNFCYGHLFISLNLNHSNFEFQQMTALNKILTYQMIRTQKVMNIKVVELIKLYNFYFGHLSISLNLSHSNFEFQQMTAWHTKWFELKNHKHKCCSTRRALQLLFGYFFIRQTFTK